tara:strand:- start:1685 stop:2710 length:1026 start_codon:yes stop_codon:yes gene_type:complete
MRIENEVKLDYKDVLIRPKRSTLASRKDVDLFRKFSFKYSHQVWDGVPIMAANMDGVGTFNMHDSLAERGLFTCAVKHYDFQDWDENYDLVDPDKIAISTGTSEHDWEKTKEIIEKLNLRFVCIDIANGYSEHFVHFIQKVRKEVPHITIIAGNVVTADMTQELIMSGADIVKVGIGPGSVCTTRIQTGVGYPQLSAVIECADAAHGLGGHIIADGGCTCPGDVAKAFGAGADFVMLGGVFAGHDEGGGEIIEVDGESYMQFYGMSSTEAMNKHSGGVADYRSSEGRVVRVPYRGKVDETIKDMLGGIRSTCTYVGAPTLKQLSKCTTFVRCTQQFNSVFV